MMHVITGGSASGKSAYGEQQVLECGASNRYYIATMRPWGEEGKARVEKHRSMREDKNFVTIECYTEFAKVRLDLDDSEKRRGTPEDDKMDLDKERENTKDDRVVLLECMSNLAANELFEAGGTDEEILARIEDGIRHLQTQVADLIVVTNEVFSDGCTYEPETLRYIRLLGQINVRLAALADRVTEVVFGIPVAVKQ